MRLHVWCPALGGTTTSRHWLPDRRRVYFKMNTLVYLSLSGLALAYLAADCQLISDEDRCQRQLRSATSRMCVGRRTYSNYGDRCFAAAGPNFRRCGTAFQLKCDKLTLAFNDLSGY